MINMVVRSLIGSPGKQMRIGIRPMQPYMAAGLPAGTSWEVRDGLIRMALRADPTGEGREQARIVRAVRAVALHAARPAVAGDRIVLVDERPGDIRMADDAGLLRRFDRLVRGASRMRAVAVAAGHPAFRNRMVEVLPELVHLAAMTAS